MAGLPTVGGVVLSEWLLHKSQRKRMPNLNEVTPMLMSLDVTIHEGATISPMYGAISLMTRPHFFLSEYLGKGCRVGSGWIFNDKSALTPFHEALVSNKDLVSRCRFALFEASGAANLFLSFYDENNPDVVSFMMATEVDGENNRITLGFIDRKTGRTLQALDQNSRKYCPFCTIRNEVCTCSSNIKSRYFDAQLKTRRRDCLYAPDGLSSHSLSYTHMWMGGTWGYEVRGIPAFSVNTSFCSGGEEFDRARELVMQVEVQEAISPFTTLSLEDDYAELSVDHFRVEDQAPTTSTAPTTPTGSDVSDARFNCTMCSASFRRKYDINRHIACVHEKSRDYVCEICSRSFMQKGHLNEHMRAAHDESSAFACTFCGKRFGIKSKLQRHVLAVHMNVREFACSVCGKSYKEKHILKKHMFQKHNMEST
eukprot:CAMPEP_0198725264 /NCGR_PEP_ID=MMETSP1475-20131203/2608_1 /TAXON_ID= ORGANISM="Unidentified sp., Strain CCMP1999" /NCGR_SAMPLE_ID=MMETSP1475 /ASSEMBLY_ACC=CAM_ASM_001111 /LENGTH=424 /DNA_ID=CAMNT_0044487007 /DNA_START=503 /DNA_END=1777 /DNA_ORIENTATION=+